METSENASVAGAKCSAGETLDTNSSSQTPSKETQASGPDEKCDVCKSTNTKLVEAEARAQKAETELAKRDAFYKESLERCRDELVMQYDQTYNTKVKDFCQKFEDQKKAWEGHVNVLKDDIRKLKEAHAMNLQQEQTRGMQLVNELMDKSGKALLEGKRKEDELQTKISFLQETLLAGERDKLALTAKSLTLEKELALARIWRNLFQDQAPEHFARCKAIMEEGN